MSEYRGNTQQHSREYLYGVLALTSNCRITVSARRGTRHEARGVRFVELLPSYHEKEADADAGAGLLRNLYCRVKPGLATSRGPDVWAKAIPRRRESTAQQQQRRDREGQELELVEVLGPVGDARAEARALLGRFGVLPCRYPDPVTRLLGGDGGAERALPLSSRSKNEYEREPDHGVVTVDAAGTRDRDDALGFRMLNDTAAELSIHVVDVAALALSCRKDSPPDVAASARELLSWAQARGCSAYFAGTAAHMLPPAFVHGRGSLDADGTARPCASLVLQLRLRSRAERGGEVEVEDVVGERLQMMTVAAAAEEDGISPWVAVDANLTYDEFAASANARWTTLRRLIEGASGGAASADEPEAQVQWAMMRFNRACASRVCELCVHHDARGAGNDAQDDGRNTPSVALGQLFLLRVQAGARAAAEYATVARGLGAHHASACPDADYGHFSSPLRRYADLRNQVVLHLLPVQKQVGVREELVLRDVDVRAVNARMTEMKRFHASYAVMELAYLCMREPRVVWARVCVHEGAEEDGGRRLFLHVCGVDGGSGANQRSTPLRIPLHDSYYADGLREDILHCASRAPEGAAIPLVLEGVRPRHRAELRVSLSQTRPSSPPFFLAAAASAAPEKQQRGHGRFPARNTHGGGHDDGAEGDARERERREPRQETEEMTTMMLDTKITRACARMRALLGFELDAFQKEALEALLCDEDVLGMAPTGSGKTVLAVLAVVLRAFDVGARAVLTTPMKALSNQKYAEFDAWLGRVCPGRGRRVSLLTGDIQVRATPPGGDGAPELLIMTSEIYANKAEHVAATSFADDPDLRGVAVVVMDEVHYINDPGRGHVWERGIMDTPAHVQLVTLSATLREPERLVAWMRGRGDSERRARVVARRDRHVPLHVGVYGGDGRRRFVELYCTERPGKMALSEPEFVSALRGDEDDDDDDDSSYAPRRLATRLREDDKLPAIVFMMSRVRCTEAARAIEQNLLVGPRPVPPRARGASGAPDLSEQYAYEVAAAAHQERVAEVRREQERLFRARLLPYLSDLRDLPGFPEFLAMLDRGVAVHHAGMLPTLREYVELLFQARLLRLVFATETLGVGIDMPARTTVITQLDKPSGAGSSTRSLRPDEFWQMAGRAGRRGRDARGYVVLLPAKNERRGKYTVTAWYRDVRNALLGALPTVTSQLRVDSEFVLHRLTHGCLFSGSRLTEARADPSLRRSLLFADLTRRREALLSTVSSMNNSAPEDGERQADVEAYVRLSCCPTWNGMQVRLTPKQAKARASEMRALTAKYGGSTAVLAAWADAAHERENMRAQLLACEQELDACWQDAVAWLARCGFLRLHARTQDAAAEASSREGSEVEVTPRGRAAAEMSDGLPLVRGAVIEEGLLDDPALSFDDVAAWLACFAERIVRVNDNNNGQADSAEGGKEFAFAALMARTQEVVEQFFDGDNEDAPSLAWDNARLMRVWLQTHDVRQVCSAAGGIDGVWQAGAFVRVVLRVLAFMEEMDSALLGLHKYRLHERLRADRHARLLRGVVTNASLYTTEKSL